MDLYDAMKACQFEDCRVQMWGCQAVKADADPRGYDPTWNKYSSRLKVGPTLSEDSAP